MGAPQDLLRTAFTLLATEPDNESAFRRAISTAYYALFHQLIEDACRLWSIEEHRARLSRQFEHKRMRDASADFAEKYVLSSDEVQKAGGHVAKAFIRAQQMRHAADYDLTIPIAPADATSEVYAIEAALVIWDAIKAEPLARDYLYSLLFRDRT